MFRLCFSPGETVEAIIQIFGCESCFYVKSHFSLFFYYYNVLVHCIYVYVVFALNLSR